MLLEFDVALLDFLLADTALAAEVDDRIRPEKGEPCGDLPYIVFSLVSEEDVLTQDGPIGHVHAQYQIDIWADTSLKAKQVARLVKNSRGGSGGQRLHGFRGVMGDAAFPVQLAWISGKREEFDPGEVSLAAGGRSEGLYRIGLELEVWYQQPQSTAMMSVMRMADEPGDLVEVTSVEMMRVELRPGDKLLLLSDDVLTSAQRHLCRLLLAEHFPDHAGPDGSRVLILDGGKRLAVIGTVKEAHL